MTRSTTIFSRGDVVYVPFRFTEKDVLKNRPAVVISSDDYHIGRNEVVLVGVTSNIDRKLVGEVAIGDWQICGLLIPSATSGILQTVRNTQIGRKIGKLSAVDQGAIDSNLKLVLGL